MRHFAAPAILLAALAACSSDSTGSDPQFHDYAPEALVGLPGLTPSGYTSVFVSINESGQIAGSSGGRAYRWTNGSLEMLPALNGDVAESHVTRINDGGWVVGSSRASAIGLGQATLWRPGQPPFGVLLDYMRPTFATDVNASGTVVGYSMNDAAFLWTRAFRWTPDGAVTGLPACSSNLEVSEYAAGINSAGTIVGHCVDRWRDSLRVLMTRTVAMLWNAALQPIVLPTPEGSVGMATAVNDSGLVVGTITGSSASYPVVWHQSGGSYVMQRLQMPAESTAAVVQVPDVNNKGGIVGSIGYSAVYWSSPDAAPRVLAPVSGSTRASAFSINDSGVIVGWSGSTPVRWSP